MFYHNILLTVPASCISEGCIKIKKVQKIFVKPFEAPQRNVKINFFSSSRIGKGRVNIASLFCLKELKESLLTNIP